MKTVLEHEIARFEEIARWARDRGSRVGYFAALYLGVTRAIGKNLAGITPDQERPNFDDPHRMARFIGVFAKRYFDAWDGYCLGDDPTQTITVAGRASEPWRVHFDHCDSDCSTIMQILGSGANAHMNFDLALSAIEVGGEKLEDFQSLKYDYDTINAILKQQIAVGHHQVRAESPLIRIADLFPKIADRVVGQLIWNTRDVAWRNALKLREEIWSVPVASVRDAENIRGLERDTAALGRRIVRPPLPIHLVLAHVLARFEPSGPDGVASVIDRFMDITPDDDFVSDVISRPRSG